MPNTTPEFSNTNEDIEPIEQEDFASDMPERDENVPAEYDENGYFDEDESEYEEYKDDEDLEYAEYIDDGEAEDEKLTLGKLVYEFVHSALMPVLYGILVALILTQVIFFHATVPSGSMETTIMTGDRLIASRVYLWFSKPQHGDVMIFWSDEYDEFLVKRVIGCPGDTVEIKDGSVYVNGDRISDSYTSGPTYALIESENTWVVPEDSYFMLGDNRNNSADSRYWMNPYASLDDMYAKVLIRYSVGEHGWYLLGIKDIDFYQE